MLLDTCIYIGFLQTVQRPENSERTSKLYAQFSVTLKIVPLFQKLSSCKAIMLVWCWLKFRPRIHCTTQKFNNFWYFCFTFKCNEKQRGISKMYTSCKYMYCRSAIWSLFISCCINIVALMNIQYSLETEGLETSQLEWNRRFQMKPLMAGAGEQA